MALGIPHGALIKEFARKKTLMELLFSKVREKVWVQMLYYSNGV